MRNIHYLSALSLQKKKYNNYENNSPDEAESERKPKLFGLKKSRKSREIIFDNLFSSLSTLHFRSISLQFAWDPFFDFIFGLFRSHVRSVHPINANIFNFSIGFYRMNILIVFTVVRNFHSGFLPRLCRWLDSCFPFTLSPVRFSILRNEM